MYELRGFIGIGPVLNKARANAPVSDAVQAIKPHMEERLLKHAPESDWGVKSPTIHEGVELLMHYMPNCHIICLYRNLVDHAKSFQMFRLKNDGVKTPLIQLVNEMAAHNLTIAKRAEELSQQGRPVMFTTYEGLKSKPWEEASKIAEFLGVSTTDSMREKVLDFVDPNLYTWKDDGLTTMPVEVTPDATVQQGHPYVYVFTREDIPSPQQAVQSCHACIEATKAFDIDRLPDHPSVIILSAKNENKLHRVRKYLIEQGIRHVHFYEPDFEDQLTAVATEPIWADRRGVFSKYQLLREGGQSVYQHGQSVRNHFFELTHALKHNDEETLRKWRIPKWLLEYKDRILDGLHERGKIELYTLYHDCGKPYCRYVDKKTGSVHFPNHADVSRHIWMCVGGNELVGNLIADDMVIHTATAEEIDAKLDEDWFPADALTLLVAALSEIHSNAKMFGGIESTSFKSKWKKVDRRGKQITKRLFGEK
ncbi:unnamed protein product [Symbiodinium microadriaticum]|nr:unnamed protein product [Symbiodinium microadriaticum]